MTHRVKTGIMVAPVSTEIFPGEEAQRRGVQGSREPYRPNLFSLVAAETFASWRDLGWAPHYRRTLDLGGTFLGLSLQERH